MVTRYWTYGVTDSEEGEDGGQDGSAVFRSGDRHAVQARSRGFGPRQMRHVVWRDEEKGIEVVNREDEQKEKDHIPSAFRSDV